MKKTKEELEQIEKEIELINIKQQELDDERKELFYSQHHIIMKEYFNGKTVYYYEDKTEGLLSKHRFSKDYYTLWGIKRALRKKMGRELSRKHAINYSWK